MKRIPRLILGLFIIIGVLKASTFGWRLWSKPMVIEKTDTVLVQQLRERVDKLARHIGDRSMFKYRRLNEAAGYIAREFSSLGYKVKFGKYRVGTKTFRNIIAVKEGEFKPQEVVIVGAHYDTCYNPGADDNASGVAGLLALAEALSDRDTARTVKFIAFVNEEPPFFKTDTMGSRVYTRSAKEKGEDIKAAFILEMIGYYSSREHSQRYPPLLGIFYPNKGDFIAVVGNIFSRGLVKRTVSLFKEETSFPIEALVAPAALPGVDFSDHWSFWQEGYPAVMITDTAFYRNPHYHHGSDTPEKLDYEAMAQVIKGLKAVLEAFSV